MHGPVIDMIMARISAGGVADYYLTDLLGSVRQIVDKTGVNVLDALTYGSFGKVLTETSPSAGDRFKYAAREWEAAIDQYHNRARWYDPDASENLRPWRGDHQCDGSPARRPPHSRPADG